ncbi:MAG: hypothetical protein JWM11_3656 [Planctomycetaceae bacterium]|nr:hypothetical protein [Planctomycetaceae bacterium]
MFRCEFCQVLVGPGIPSSLVVLKTRPKIYPVRERGKRRSRDERRRDPKKSKWIPDFGGTGHEIVQESRACPTCRDACKVLTERASPNASSCTEDNVNSQECELFSALPLRVDGQ